MLVSTPPSIPDSRMYEPDDLEEPLLLWVHAGTMHLSIDGGPETRVESGSGMWLPPHTPHDFWTEPGTIALPLWGFDAPAAPPEGPGAGVRRFEVPAESAAGLIDLYPRQGFEDLFGLAGPQLSREDVGAALAAPARPPMPRFGPALRVATQLHSYPALDHSVEEWAAWAACSPNTLRRGFLAQTQMTFSRWRHVSRLAHAAELLASGWPVGEAAAAVGFASRWGFAGAFRARYGVTPRDFAAQAGSAAREASAVSGTAEPRPAFEAADPVCQDHNTMIWVREGELRAGFAGQTWVGREGDVVWLPAGATVESSPESAVPLSILCTECVQLERPRRARFSRAWNDWLLWASVSTNTLIRPAEHHGFRPWLERPMHAHVIEAFEAQVALEQARRVPLPRDAAARAAATAFLKGLGTSAETGIQDVPAAARRAFRQDTGMSLAEWRLAARMRVARRLLQDGVPASNVATRVGYTMLSNFSRAFSRFHGISPRQFQALEGPDDHLLVG